MSRAAIRYAKAILSLATDKKADAKVNNDMKLIANTISENTNLDTMLKSATIKSAFKKETVLKIFPELNTVSQGMLDVLVSNKRIDILQAVAIQYTKLFDAKSGKEIATVTTAVPMNSNLETKVLAKIKELSDKTVELENIVDQSILGGFILRIGDKQYNASIANKLNKLKREFTLN